jgi:hypothetical protein
MREFDRVLLAKRLSRDENYSTDAHVPQRSLPAATMGVDDGMREWIPRGR